MSEDKGLLNKIRHIVGIDSVQLKMEDLLPKPQLKYTEADVLESKNGLMRLFRLTCIQRQITEQSFRDCVHNYMEANGATTNQILDRISNLRSSILKNQSMTYATFVELMETIGAPLEALGVEALNTNDPDNHIKEAYWDDDVPEIPKKKRVRRKTRGIDDLKYDAYDIVDTEGDLARIFRLVCFKKNLTDRAIRELIREYYLKEGLSNKQVSDKINNLNSTTLRNPTMTYVTFIELMTAIKHTVIKFGVKTRQEGSLKTLWEF